MLSRAESRKLKRQVESIRVKMPPGTQVRDRSTGKLYIVGVPFRMTDIWLMSVEEGKKGLIRKSELIRKFDLCAS